MSEIGTRQPRSDAQANHKALLGAAARLFAQRGAEVTYEEIAHEAGVGRATLYRHFPHRDDLLAAILDSVIDHLQDVADDLPDDGSGLLALFHACLELQERTLPFIDFVTRSTPPESRERMRSRFEALFEQPLRAAQAAGTVRTDLSPADVRILVLMISSLSDQKRPPAERIRAIELAEDVLRGNARRVVSTSPSGSPAFDRVSRRP